MNNSNKLPKSGQWTVYVEPEMIHLASILDHKAGGYLVRNTTQANARLIAAAPDLLEALDEIEKILRAECATALTREGRKAVEAMNIARTALAKVL